MMLLNRPELCILIIYLTACSSQFHNSPNSDEYVDGNSTELRGPENMEIPLGICQMYKGKTCEKYLKNQTVFIAPQLTMELLEERLSDAYNVIRESK